MCVLVLIKQIVIFDDVFLGRVDVDGGAFYYFLR